MKKILWELRGAEAGLAWRGLLKPIGHDAMDVFHSSEVECGQWHTTYTTMMRTCRLNGER